MCAYICGYGGSQAEPCSPGSEGPTPQAKKVRRAMPSPAVAGGGRPVRAARATAKSYVVDDDGSDSDPEEEEPESEEEDFDSDA
eukprot:325383-Prorocentrum_minimum.AAC.1